ncbi:chromate transporter [Paenibacillus yonginensis]|uniref:Chromate transporter n=1 Tax=Paenibacillus yonginensis TaxID=1462996 RepID=A0A1B1MWA0_9BACL|nr:chromate transporter [Paenibacillus yonginensis]ANS73448.1 chromate transporter [Paenibacillus yonginensis]
MFIWQLFWAFLKIGFLSFGGGYAVLSMIQYETHSNGWMSDAEFRETVSLSGMSPGSIATNSATLIGYHAAGLPGAIAATSGIILPSLIVVILIAAFFFKIHTNFWVKSSFYGLRPIITGLILYAAIHFAFPSRNGSILDWTTLGTLLIGAATFIAVVKYKVHPLAIILLSACAGIVIF